MRVICFQKQSVCRRYHPHKERSDSHIFLLIPWWYIYFFPSHHPPFLHLLWSVFRFVAVICHSGELSIADLMCGFPSCDTHYVVLSTVKWRVGVEEERGRVTRSPSPLSRSRRITYSVFTRYSRLLKMWCLHSWQKST